MAEINNIISSLEQTESTEYLFYPGSEESGPPWEKPDTDFTHAPNPHEQSIWFKTYE